MVRGVPERLRDKQTRRARAEADDDVAHEDHSTFVAASSA